ncbi:helix-turn-helix transcriptional regulator [Microvirga sp. TS319]|uniref:S24 family peptidase n=1 Tax=Microvirga sp. TS319 TaxID=3241165 RepID=UPI003519DF37
MCGDYALGSLLLLKSTTACYNEGSYPGSLLKRDGTSSAEAHDQFPVIDSFAAKGALSHGVGPQKGLDVVKKLQCLAHAHQHNGQMPFTSMGKGLIDDGQESGQSPTMDDAQKDQWRKKLEGELRRQNKDMKRVSIEARLGATYVRDFLKKGRGKMENLRKISQVLTGDPDWLTSDDPSPAGAEKEPAPTRTISRPSIAPNASQIVAPPALSTDVIPVKGLAVGGDNGKFIFNGETLGTVPRPPALVGVPNAYATYVSGDSMYPRYKAGEQVWVHPSRPPRRGDDVVVQIHPEEEGEPPEGYIKEFVAWTPTMLVLRQFNPDKEIEIDRDLIISVHLIIGSLKA